MAGKYVPPGAGLGAFLGRKYEYPKREALYPDMMVQGFNPADWEKRPDGSDKGQGYLGVLQRPDGGVSTEISISSDDIANGQDFPLMVPTLSRDEVKSLLGNNAEGPAFFKNLPPSVMEKAVDFARHRQLLGLPLFAQPYEYVNPPGNNKPQKKK